MRYLACFVGSLKEPALRDKVLAYLVEKIYIYDDKIVINLYYGEDNREINLQEFKEHLKNIDNIMKYMDGEASFEDYQKELLLRQRIYYICLVWMMMCLFKWQFVS